MALAILIAIFIAGAIALRIGLRGRIIDDHPQCAACGFDLTGRLADTRNCGECGAFLGGFGSTVIGHRVYRNKWVGTGAGFLVMSIGCAALMFFDSANPFNINQHLPTRVLLLMAEYLPGSGGGALAEIMSRGQLGTLSNSDSFAAVETALGVQGRTSTTWDYDYWDGTIVLKDVPIQVD
jgi:hypothetical protein